MRLIGKLGDRMLGRLVPKTQADAACYGGYIGCGSCNRLEHVKRCCTYYDNCPAAKCHYAYC
ncbi:hypothetical protein AB0I28_36775 [Phytomonospora sp. NPDC050363]|uniref:hypothetical protein n=1 Tax=Phytomonospora sp. NPDC050363 TaxID=3155642 RepID=UPI0033EFA53A